MDAKESQNDEIPPDQSKIESLLTKKRQENREIMAQMRKHGKSGDPDDCSDHSNTPIKEMFKREEEAQDSILSGIRQVEVDDHLFSLYQKPTDIKVLDHVANDTDPLKTLANYAPMPTDARHLFDGVQDSVDHENAGEKVLE